MLVLCFNYAWSSGQDVSSKKDIHIGITAYSFAYNTKFERGNVAIGPSLFLNDEKLSIQVGILFDLNEYNLNQSVHFGNSQPVRRYNLFVPILIHYTYYRSNKINTFLTAGIILGGKFYDSHNETNGFSLIVGTGMSYQIVKGLYLRATPTIRFNSDILFPGVLVDFTISI